MQFRSARRSRTRSACSHRWLLRLSPISDEYPHGVVNHASGEYVVGAIHTNTIEGFWSLVKRGVVGTFHKVSRKYLPLYVAEFPVPLQQPGERRHLRRGDQGMLRP